MNIEQAIATARVLADYDQEVSRVAQEFNGFEGLV